MQLCLVVLLFAMARECAVQQMAPASAIDSFPRFFSATPMKL